MREEVLSQLRKRSEENYKEFNCKLIPGVDKEMVLGVRVPDIRAQAKELLKQNYKGYLAELEAIPMERLYYEEVMLQGMIIGEAKLELSQHFAYIQKFVPRINNWAICDTVCTSMKFARKTQNQEEVWNFLQQYLTDDREFFVRFGVVMLLSHFINDAYIDRVLAVLEGINHPGYYVKMAVAWTLSACYIKYYRQTMVLLVDNRLDDVTHNKTIQKIRESGRVSKGEKDRLNKLKR